MGCAPCAKRAQERRERMLAEMQAQIPSGESLAPDMPREDKTYVETHTNTAYAEFKKKLYNHQALYPKQGE